MKKSTAPIKNGPDKGYFSDGTLESEGSWKDGKRVGPWKFYYKNSQVKAIGTYTENGEFTGSWKWWRENGRVLQFGDFNDGKQVGPWKRYHANGQLMDEGSYGQDGNKVGEWKVYNPDSSLKSTKVFKVKE